MTMTAERVALEVEPPGELVPCFYCRDPIAPTVLGWMHVDGRGVPVSWFCPEPHMTLAGPQPSLQPQTPAAPDVERADEPSPAPARSTPPADRPLPDQPWWAQEVAPAPEHRRPTEIPRSPRRGQAADGREESFSVPPPAPGEPPWRTSQ